MTTISSTTGTITSAGIGSGLDVTSIISSLMAVDSLPLTQLQSQATTMQTTLSAFGQIQSLVSGLQTASQALTNPDTFNQTNTSSSNSSSVSATTTNGAVAGNYSVSVSSLSAAQTIVSPTGQYTDGTSVVGTGSLTIQLGTWSAGNSTFTPSAASAITIPIGASADTLAGVQAAINAANAGVTATIVTDASGARLALQSSSSGAANGFKVTVADGDGNNTDASGLSRLAYDPSTTNASQMTLAQSAANTQATINGISVTSSTNSLSGVIGGITFNVNQTTSQPATVSVTQNTSAIQTAVSGFVSAYNSLQSFLATETAYDPTSNTAAPLQGDSTTTGIQNQMRSMLSQTTGASSVFATLSSIGVQFQKDGSLSLDNATFTSALGNLPELTKALSNIDPTNASNDGFGEQFNNWTTNLLNTGGTIPNKTAAIQSEITSNKNDQTALKTRLAQVQSALQAQYTALDATMSQENSLASFVTQQFYKSSSTSGSSSN
jgi:flagellar hook-associated protein 2